MTATSRRNALGHVVAGSAALALPAAAAAGVLGGAPALAGTMASEVDPHVAWEWEALALQDRLNGEPELEQHRFDVLHERWNALQELIAETPAMTLAGLAAQLRLVKSGFDEGSAVATFARKTAIETALTTLTGGRA